MEKGHFTKSSRQHPPQTDGGATRRKAGLRNSSSALSCPFRSSAPTTPRPDVAPFINKSNGPETHSNIEVSGQIVLLISGGTRHLQSLICTFIAVISTLGYMNLQTSAAADSTVSLKDVAGDYYFGDGTGVNCSLALTKQGAFAFTWRGCLGTYDENKGRASLTNGVLHIAPSRPNIREGFRGTPTDFFPVRWGTRTYLIPTNDIVEFCSDVNQGSEPRRGNWGEYYLRRNDWNKPIAGLPSVPERLTGYFLKKPVSGKVTELIGKQEAWLDLGTEHGVLQGMVLTAQDYGKLMFSQVKVEAVEKKRCRIKCQWKDSELALGQAVSSRFHE